MKTAINEFHKIDKRWDWLKIEENSARILIWLIDFKIYFYVVY